MNHRNGLTLASTDPRRRSTDLNDDASSVVRMKGNRKC
jgi:hypothetical protein